MAKKRERMEVIYDILRIIRNNGTIKPTPLLRYSNLSSQRFSLYMAELLKKGLVKEAVNAEGRKTISLTEKGQRYLDKYKVIKSFVEDFDL